MRDSFKNNQMCIVGEPKQVIKLPKLLQVFASNKAFHEVQLIFLQMIRCLHSNIHTGYSAAPGGWASFKGASYYCMD